MTDPIKFARSLRDSEKEKEVFHWLQNQSQEKRFAFVWTVINENSSLGFVLVKHANLKPIFLQVILEKGLVYGDASSVRGWIDAVMEGLGYKKTLSVISEHIEKAPLCVFKTLYWLPILFKNAPDEIQNEISELKKLFNKKYPDYNPTRVIGTHA